MGGLIFFGLLCLIAGGDLLRRGRGGKMTRNGATLTLIGLFCLFVAIHSTIGTNGIIFLVSLAVTLWLVDKTGLGRWLLKTAMNYLDELRRR